MRIVVLDAPIVDVVTIDNASEEKFYTLKSAKSNRPYVLIRANATVGDHRQEDQWHWVAIGKTRNRATGSVTFKDAMDRALKYEGNEVQEHDTMSEALTRLTSLAGVYESGE